MVVGFCQGSREYRPKTRRKRCTSPVREAYPNLIEAGQERPNAGFGATRGRKPRRNSKARPWVFKHKRCRIAEFVLKHVRDVLPVLRCQHPVQPIGFEREAGVPRTSRCRQHFVVSSNISWFMVTTGLLAAVGRGVRGDASPNRETAPARADVPPRCIPRMTTACRLMAGD